MRRSRTPGIDPSRALNNRPDAECSDPSDNRQCERLPVRDRRTERPQQCGPYRAPDNRE
jgi:hypothetical protein